jgi:polar amino acid transport system substrate-binding protein
MIQFPVAVIAMVLLASCATVPELTPAARSELAPTGKLRVGINFQNALLTRKDPVTGAAGGIAVDLAHELGRRLGLPVEIVPYTTAGNMADAVKTGAWDVAFLGADPGRAGEISFTAAYLEIEATYLVPAGSPLRTLADVDRKGIRIAVPEKSAYDHSLTRLIQQAQIVRIKGTAATFNYFVKEKLDALAGLKPGLVESADKLPGSRVLDGRFSVVNQAIGTPRGREAGAQYLAEFVEEAKLSGLIARAIEKNAVRGVSVAPTVQPSSTLQIGGGMSYGATSR